MVDGRPSWDEFFLAGCEWVKSRADCSRRKVGAILVDSQHRLVSTGYNGAESGGPSCLSGDCPRASSSVLPGSSYDTGPGACIAVHAEANALLYAGERGARMGTLYISDAPCDGCKRLILAAGVARVVWPNGTWDIHSLPG